MNRKGSLADLVNELKSQNLQKKDFVIPARMLSMQNGKLIVNNYDENPDLIKLLGEVGITSPESGKLELDVLDVLHGNLSDKLEIPRKYYNKIMLEKKLLDENVSYWLNKKKENVFLRTFINKEENKGFGRAMLSDRYNVIDNFDVLFACLEAVKDSGLKLEIEDGGCDLSENRMYLRFINPNIEIQAPELLKNYKSPKGDGANVGDGIISGFVISNSEVGQGSFNISPRAVVLKCKNGMVFKDDAFGKVHLGAKMEKYSQIDWSEETKRKNYELIMSQVKDAIKKFTSEDFLAQKINQLNDYAKQELAYPLDTVRNVTKTLNLSEEKERSILDFFMKGNDYSVMGVSQAITFYAHETKDADEAFDLEMAAVDMLPKIKDLDKPTVSKSTQTQAVLN